MSKPILLDLFCKAGGCTKGYQEAGFYVVGVDIKPQPHYIGDEFYQDDALTFPLDGFDVIHASPPCQAYSQSKSLWKRNYPQLLEPIRERLKNTGKHWIIENVPGSPMDDFLLLCGSMFGLQVRRHRWFENSFGLTFSPFACHHEYKTVRCFGHSNKRDNSTMALKKEAMGIDWMTEDEIAEAIPPAYTKYIGLQLMDILERESITSWSL